MQICGAERPDVSVEIIQEIVLNHYGFKTVSITKLPGYDDYSAVITYHSDAVMKHNNRHEQIESAVLKILGYDNSCKHELQQLLGVLCFMWFDYCWSKCN